MGNWSSAYRSDHCQWHPQKKKSDLTCSKSNVSYRFRDKVITASAKDNKKQFTNRMTFVMERSGEVAIRGLGIAGRCWCLWRHKSCHDDLNLKVVFTFGKSWYCGGRRNFIVMESQYLMSHVGTANWKSGKVLKRENLFCQLSKFVVTKTSIDIGETNYRMAQFDKLIEAGATHRENLSSVYTRLPGIGIRRLLVAICVWSLPVQADHSFHLEAVRVGRN